MKTLFGLIYGLSFFALAIGSFVVMYMVSPYILYFFAFHLTMQGLRHGLKVRNNLTKWSDRVMTGLDIFRQVLFSPILNIGVTTEHKFGSPRETASSVVGKNLRDTGLFRWRFIEKVVSVLLEGGRPHSIPSIEE